MVPLQKYSLTHFWPSDIIFFSFEETEILYLLGNLDIIDNEGEKFLIKESQSNEKHIVDG